MTQTVYYAIQYPSGKLRPHYNSPTMPALYASAALAGRYIRPYGGKVVKVTLVVEDIDAVTE